MSLRTLRVGPRLALGFGVVLAILVGVAAASIIITEINKNRRWFVGRNCRGRSP